jgi:2-polyprenyl-6-methoxyphenol hydroxylase-like FAD-dependent oxidoreductase
MTPAVDTVESHTAFTDVLIVGAGPVGLCLASELARFGIPFRIIDQSPTPTESSNAIAIHARTLELLARMGSVADFVGAGTVVDRVEFQADGRVMAHIDFTDIQSRYRGILDIPQSSTESIFIKRLSEHGVNVERPVKLVSLSGGTADVKAELAHNDGSREAISCKWAIGCDGAHSTVREKSGIPFEGTTTAECYVLADVKIAWALTHSQMTVFFHREGTLVTIPLPEGRYRIVANVSNLEQAQVKSLPFQEFRTIVARRVSISAQLSDPGWMSHFVVNRRQAREYRKNRVFVAGDAAHVHSPAGGQGMNTGIQDVINLGWKLALVHEGKAAESLLDTYFEERAPIASGVLTLTNRIMALTSIKNPVMQRIRNLALPMVAGWDFVQHGLVDELTELGLNYRRSPVVRGEGPFPGNAPHPGDRAPLSSIPGTNAHGGRNLGDVFDGTVHTLLLFAGEGSSLEDFSVLSAIRRDFEAAYPGLIYGYVVTWRADGSTSGVIPDPDGTVHRDYGAARNCFYLIRPDLYVAYRCAPPDAAALHRFLHESYGFSPVHRVLKP